MKDHFSGALHHLPDEPRGFLPGTDKLHHIPCPLGGHEKRHSNSHIEYLVQFILRHTPLFADHFEDWQHPPGVLPEDYIAARREHARKIVHEPAPRDVSKPLDHTRTLVV